MQADPAQEMLLATSLRDEWMDAIDQLSNSGHYTLFAEAEDVFLKKIEIDNQYLKDTGCYAAVTESHLTIVERMRKGEMAIVTCQVVDLINTTAHVIMALKNNHGHARAYLECTFVNIKRNSNGEEVIPFGRYQLANLVSLFREHKELPMPIANGARRLISIRRV